MTIAMLRQASARGMGLPRKRITSGSANISA
jgi:hypothetical protein